VVRNQNADSRLVEQSYKTTTSRDTKKESLTKIALSFAGNLPMLTAGRCGFGKVGGSVPGYLVVGNVVFGVGRKYGEGSTMQVS